MPAYSDAANISPDWARPRSIRIMSFPAWISRCANCGTRICFPQFAQRLIHAGKLMMRIERGLAQSGEMFAASEYAGIVQPVQKLARVDNHLLWIVRNRP